jgi:uncharacterized protein (TIGR02996 family)
MGDQDAILEAIFAAPADDAPRLVYADWLDEHGHPEQAEFIRRHIELFRTPANDYARLARAAALEASWNRFKIELVESLPATEVRLDLYSRGLPELVYDTTADRFLADAADWWPLFPVRKLGLDGWMDRADEIGLSRYLSRVTNLILRGGEVDFHAARALVASPHLANVPRLSITRASHEIFLLLRGHFGDRLIVIW